MAGLRRSLKVRLSVDPRRGWVRERWRVPEARKNVREGVIDALRRFRLIIRIIRRIAVLSIRSFP
ncbi:hypothetical protein BRAS3843_1900008 [Bradyrhizobium sp. STM 3843]|nr:hypothetical protein BRAS3843_1900008 [Bradyrhizobium sp. STM 3843]